MGRAHYAGEQALREHLSALTHIHGPILDIGAGTDRTVMTIAESVPQVDILAVEAAPAMRAVAPRTELRQRVTIIPDTVDQFSQRLSAVVAFGVLGHLTSSQRQGLWPLLLRLATGAPIFVKLLPVEKTVVLARMTLANETVGQRHYEATLEGEPGPDDTMLLTSCWTVSSGPCATQVIRKRSVWHCLNAI